MISYLIFVLIDVLVVQLSLRGCCVRLQQVQDLVQSQEYSHVPNFASGPIGPENGQLFYNQDYILL